jgi:DNA polymerase elongation subunit (family B)
MFWDIECLAKELPTYEDPKYPISCISIYDSLTEQIRTFFLGDFTNEEEMLLSFSKHIRNSKPDLLLAWNSENFDYPYVHNRYNKVTKKNFSRDISPIKDSRKYYKIDDMYYPAGISILDYLLLFKKIRMREESYTLDFIAKKHTGKGKEYHPDFTKLTEEVRLRNIGDVQILVDLEKQYKILPYFDEIRLMSKSLWEDLYHNSYIIENLLFEEAKKKRVVLPNCPVRGFEGDDEGFEGATRECIKTGALFDIGKFDLSSAYPQMILNFCLDSQNINIDKEGILINNIYWKQNKEALLPSLIKKLLILKDTLKEELQNSSGTDEEKKAQINYDAIKAIVNSSFGVMGHVGFRLFNNGVASTITFLVRELLMYVKDNIEKEGYKILYWDTDGLMIDNKEDISKRLNELVRQWAKEKYNKESISIEFAYEGYFDRLFLLTKCRYYGYLQTKKGLKEEIKGIEAKRANSSRYEKEYQKNLLEQILNKKTQEEIVNWIESEKERMKSLPLIDISFPCKIANKKYDKNVPIFIRAYANTKAIKPTFIVEKGELFYYIFLDHPSKERDVLAFTEHDQEFLKDYRIDYDKLTDRNINNKTENIFEAMGWQYTFNNQLSLF